MIKLGKNRNLITEFKLIKRWQVLKLVQNDQNKLNIALQRVEAHFGRQTRFSGKGPMDQLIATILSQRTTYINEKQAFDTMWKRFGSWENIMLAPIEALTKAISSSNYAEVKAPRIQQILKEIKAEKGDFNLDFLGEIPVKEAMNWLMALPGVGYKTSTFVLLFTFRKPVLPVDTHVYRVSQRLGIIGKKITEAKAHGVLLAMLPADAAELLNFHKLFFKHGQRICTWSNPRCQQCYLTDICDYYQEKSFPA